MGKSSFFALALALTLSFTATAASSPTSAAATAATAAAATAATATITINATTATFKFRTFTLCSGEYDLVKTANCTDSGVSFTIDYNRSQNDHKMLLTLEMDLSQESEKISVSIEETHLKKKRNFSLLGLVLVFILGCIWGEITGFPEQSQIQESDDHHIHIIDVQTYYWTLFNPFFNNLLYSFDSQAIDDEDDSQANDEDDEEDDDLVVDYIDETPEPLQTENDASHRLPYKKFTGYMPSLSILIPSVDAQEMLDSQDTSIEMSISPNPSCDDECEYYLPTEKFVQEADTRTFFSEVYRRWKPSEIDANFHNILALYKASHIPIVQQKPAAAVWHGRRDIKVQALEEAMAAKCREQEIEKERKTKKELFRAVIERSKNKRKEEDDVQQKRATAAAGRRVMRVKALEAAKAAKYREQEKEEERKKKKETFRSELRVKKKKQREEDERKQIAKHRKVVHIK